MYKTAADGAAFVKDLLRRVRGVAGREVLVCPPFTALAAVAKAAGGKLLVGAQNMYFEDEGAYTGEVSPAMLVDLGVTHVILGHSERRQFFGETNEGCNRKIKKALATGLTPIYCLGESLAQRRRGKTFAVLETQVREGLAGIHAQDAAKIVIAYEPIWAIGTGKTATPETAQEAHAFLRRTLAAVWKKEAQKVRLLYGGSVKPDNVDALMARPDIDGALVGGASLKADSFARIVRFETTG
jgi:triosephosphate isomerase